MTNHYKNKSQDKQKEEVQVLSPFKSVYVARQPIFDRSKKLFAYELLFRSGFDNYFVNQNGDFATSQTILHSFVTLGIDLITGGKPAFINFTRNLILDETAIIFPRELLAIEVLESIEPEHDIIEACKKIKKRGYLLILDDFEYRPELQPLVDLSDIIKIDFRSTKKSERPGVISRFNGSRIKLLAEKVESVEEFLEARELGFSYFQGYFFCKPNIIEGKEIPGYKLNYLQILREVNEPDVEFDTLEHIVKRDVSITYKLLRFINSAAFGFHAKIQSIRQALTLLGLIEFKKWVSLVALSGLGEDKPEELTVNSLMRAKLCEFIAAKMKIHNKGGDLFLLGMFSNIDAFIDLPMEGILSELPLSDEIKNALNGGSNQFRDILDTVIAYEKGDWERWAIHLSKLDIGQQEFPEIYASTVDWVNKIYR